MDNTWYTLFVVFLHWKVPHGILFQCRGTLTKTHFFTLMKGMIFFYMVVVART